MKRIKSIIALALATTTLFTLAACGNNDDASNENTNKKTLVLGTSADFPPFEFHKMVDGKDTIMGFDIELAKEIAKDLDANLEIKDIPFKSLLVEMKQGKVDFVISGMNPTPDRLVEADFSNAYYSGTQVCLVRKSDLEQYTDAAALAGKTIGVQTGSLQESLAKEQFVPAGATLTSLDKVPDVVLGLKTSKFDAAIMEEPVAAGYISQHPDLAIAFNVPTEIEEYCVAVTKGNTALLEKVNATIERLVSDGTMDQMITSAVEASVDVE